MYNYVEVRLSIIFKKDIYVKNIVEALSSGFNRCLLQHEDMKELHYNKNFKPYSFSFPSETIENNTFSKFTPYTIRFRAVDYIFESLFECLQERNNDTFYIDDITNIKTIKQNDIHLSKLVSLSPVITIKDGKCITLENIDLEDIKKRLQINAIQKFNQFEDEHISLDTEIFESVKCLNNRPISYSYKGGYLIGNKYEIKIKDDELSQKIAFVMLYSGIGEKNSLGLGFCYMRK